LIFTGKSRKGETVKHMHGLPKALLGELVQYLDIRTDVFLPGFETTWKKATKYETIVSEVDYSAWVPSLHRETTRATQTAHYVNGELHSTNDLPARIIGKDFRMWYKCGQLHRGKGLPASIEKTWNQLKEQWFIRGQHHRAHDRPAVMHQGGKKEWWRHGKRHREDDQPAIVYEGGSEKWFYDGLLHREHDRPAVVWITRHQEWWVKGRPRREDNGPSIEDSDGEQKWITDQGEVYKVRLPGGHEWSKSNSPDSYRQWRDNVRKAAFNMKYRPRIGPVYPRLDEL